MIFFIHIFLSILTVYIPQNCTLSRGKSFIGMSDKIVAVLKIIHFYLPSINCISIAYNADKRLVFAYKRLVVLYFCVREFHSLI